MPNALGFDSLNIFPQEVRYTVTSMHSLAQRLLAANQLLASYAVPHNGTLGRPVPEPADDTRFPFQRDRGRIIHSQAFRRLQGKTQVFVAGEGDHFRTRLTHTMEVAQIARDIARTLALNEDLTECIALAHDLGHPPFGHMGERALDAWLQEHGHSFEHNEQSLRVVTVLEEHSSQAQGLNLCVEILEGLQKHSRAASENTRGLSLEAQVVNLADEIAYCAHDVEDGMRAGLFTMEDLMTVPLAAEAVRRATERSTFIRGGIIHLLVTDLYLETSRRLGIRIRTLPDVYVSRKELVGLSENMRAALTQLGEFLADRMYFHPHVLTASEEGQQIVRALCERLLENPGKRVLALQQRTHSPLLIAIKDYVAGMTDEFARKQL